MNPWLLGGSFLAFALWTGGVYVTGGDAREAKVRAELAAEAFEQKDDDDALQSDAADTASDALRLQIARLERELDQAYVATGLTCDAPGSGDSVHHAYDQLFETGLPPVD